MWFVFIREKKRKTLVNFLIENCKNWKQCECNIYTKREILRNWIYENENEITSHHIHINRLIFFVFRSHWLLVTNQLSDLVFFLFSLLFNPSNPTQSNFLDSINLLLLKMCSPEFRIWHRCNSHSNQKNPHKTENRLWSSFQLNWFKV